jgi:aspartyl-tRNA(Asn)/glutamyl-tRNA(Gln) amidotransferase subunit B
MDSGKTIRNANIDLIDLNRAGIPLIEIVTEPDFNSPTEVVCFVEHLRLLLAQNNICLGTGLFSIDKNS